jgi:transcription initiation factor TFIID subunit 11
VQLQWLEASGETQTGLPSPPASDNDERGREKRRGPLTADHLREALRRYKLERKAGNVGLMGLARQQMSNGTERFGLKVMGRRLLK